MTRRFIQRFLIWVSSSAKKKKNTTVLRIDILPQLNLVNRNAAFPPVLTHPHACHG